MNNQQQVTINSYSNNKPINWELLADYAYKANLVKFSETEIRGMLLIFIHLMSTSYTYNTQTG